MILKEQCSEAASRVCSKPQDEGSYWASSCTNQQLSEHDTIREKSLQKHNRKTLNYSKTEDNKN